MHRFSFATHDRGVASTVLPTKVLKMHPRRLTKTTSCTPEGFSSSHELNSNKLEENGESWCVSLSNVESTASEFIRPCTGD